MMATPESDPNDHLHISGEESYEGEVSAISHSPSTVSEKSTDMDTKRNNEYMPLNISEEPTNRSSGTARNVLNRKALLSFMVIVVVVVAIISLTVIFVTYTDSKKDPNTSKGRRDESRYQFEDIFSGKFYADVPDDKWISDDAVIKEEDGDIVQYNVATNKTTILLSENYLRDFGINDTSSNHYSLSRDGNWILLAVSSTKKYRYSTVAKYIAVNLQSKDVINISKPDTTSSTLIRYIAWGHHGNSIVFVSDNDIYWLKSTDSDKPKAIRVTFTGKEKIIFNGIPDWVYEEEILAQRPAVIISPDENHLCYVTFNDTEVPLYEISMYGQPSRAYTRIEDIAYPKPGYPNPDIRIYIHNVNDRKNTELKPPVEMSEYYVTNLVWARSGTVSVTWLNRAQNISVVMLCSAKNGSCIQNYRLVVSNGWVDDYLDPVFSSDGSFYIQVLPKREGSDEFLHVAKVQSSVNADKDVTFLTEGQWEVKKIVSFDEKNGIVYYESSEISPTQTHLYSVDLQRNKKCLSCEMKETKDGRCRKYFSSFSTKSSWYFLNCLGPSVPMSWLLSTKDDKVTVIESNKGLQETVETTSMPTFHYFTIKTDDGAYDLHVREMRPPDFDEKKKYAVLFSIYGGPGSQEVVEIFLTGYHTYLTSNFDVIVCEVDGRGTGARGRAFQYAVYEQLGEYERNDTLTAARFMQSKSYVLGDRISVWGWSYGGFLTSFILATQEERVFGSGVAVAPVTDWRYYDSIYTERYMGQPSKDDNFIGYEYTSVLKHAANIPDNSFLLIHGTGDDNVHFQNTAQLISVLTKAGVQFELQIYTDKHHSLEGSKIHRHLYNLMTNFFKDKLNL